VNGKDVARPTPLVTAVFTPPANVAEAPRAGTLNVTVTPLTGSLCASLTVACRGDAKVVLIAALCGVSLVTVIAAGGPASP